MFKIGLLFPGQGSQTVGMGKALIDSIASAKTLYEQADQLLGIALSKTMLEGPEADLKRTDVAQPALLTASSAAWIALNEKVNLVKNDCVCAGHSLGEYSALHAAGALDFAAAIRLVRKRGEFMQQASDNSQGSMAAIIGASELEVRELCRLANANGDVQIANLNCPGQIVISGSSQALQTFYQLAKEKKIRAIPLSVAGPFHSKFMQPAAEALLAELKQANFQTAQIPVIANVDISVATTPDEIRQLLYQQVTGSVRWEQTIRFMIKQGVKLMLEIGPGKVLQGLVKKIDPGMKVLGVFAPEDMELASQAINVL